MIENNSSVPLSAALSVLLFDAEGVALGQLVAPMPLRAFSRHRDARSLDHYSQPRPEAVAIVRAVRPERG